MIWEHHVGAEIAPRGIVLYQNMLIFESAGEWAVRPQASRLIALDARTGEKIRDIEMPGVYAEGAFDLAGTVVGLVDRDALLPRPEAMQPGDRLLGLPSSGPHTNGYSLIRRAASGRDLELRLEDGQTLADALLAPHRCYLPEVDGLQQAGFSIENPNASRSCGCGQSFS